MEIGQRVVIESGYFAPYNQKTRMAIIRERQGRHIAGLG
jgi:hypothetical protein